MRHYPNFTVTIEFTYKAKNDTTDMPPPHRRSLSMVSLSCAFTAARCQSLSHIPRGRAMPLRVAYPENFRMLHRAQS
jgi:hypothetical protein